MNVRKIITKTAMSALAMVSVVGAPQIAFAEDAGSDNAAKHHEEALTPADADAFIAMVKSEFAKDSVIASHAYWLASTNINHDSQSLAAFFGAKGTEKAVKYAQQAAKYMNIDGLSYDTNRKLNILRGSLVIPAPQKDGVAEKLSKITTGMEAKYGTGRGTLNGEEVTGADIEEKMGELRDPAALAEMWESWHDNVGAPMKDDYAEMVSIANEGARELGYDDVGAMWRSQYDMSPEEFAALTEKLWQQVKPFYDELHCYVRTKLNDQYGDDVQPTTGPIRADLLGNMWAQEWGKIYDVVAPEGAGDIGYDVTDLLNDNGYDAIKMVKTGEAFFSSLGFEKLPDTFWERSQFTKPRDREVVCHASAWDIDNVDDLRIKMCIQITDEMFTTVHHELGHNYYQRAYNEQDYLYLNGANDGFHEAIGDMLALSITPEYLKTIGLIDESQIPSEDKDIGLLLRSAMDKVAFLPFGLLIDRWRWGVFDGSITPDKYNDAWTQMRLQYQGITPPVDRPDDAFDPGAKYHIPGNTPYTRYFLARILQFQFFKAACDMSGWKRPLHRCSFYGNEEVGTKLNAMLEMGSSKPWPDALEVMTGKREMDGAALVEYFKPLKGWLEQQNKGKKCGW